MKDPQGATLPVQLPKWEWSGVETVETERNPSDPSLIFFPLQSSPEPSSLEDVLMADVRAVRAEISVGEAKLPLEKRSVDGKWFRRESSAWLQEWFLRGSKDMESIQMEFAWDAPKEWMRLQAKLDPVSTLEAIRIRGKKSMTVMFREWLRNLSLPETTRERLARSITQAIETRELGTDGEFRATPLDSSTPYSATIVEGRPGGKTLPLFLSFPLNAKQGANVAKWENASDRDLSEPFLATRGMKYRLQLTSLEITPLAQRMRSDSNSARYCKRMSVHRECMRCGGGAKSSEITNDCEEWGTHVTEVEIFETGSAEKPQDVLDLPEYREGFWKHSELVLEDGNGRPLGSVPLNDLLPLDGAKTIDLVLECGKKSQDAALCRVLEEGGSVRLRTNWSPEYRRRIGQIVKKDGNASDQSTVRALVAPYRAKGNVIRVGTVRESGAPTLTFR